MKIIIVDDDCLVAGALKTILEANPDIEVTATGSDGEEACSLYREYLPDILLMDIRMKGMDGLEECWYDPASEDNPLCRGGGLLQYIHHRKK